jgi:tetratricopeptide (TPR) repeat protein
MAAAVGSTEAPLVDDALIASVLLGRGLPTAAEHHLRLAGLSYQHDEVAEQHLREAHALAPGHAAVLIGLYRFYFYKGRLPEALEVARICLDKAARENGLDRDWWLVERRDADFGGWDAVLPRFYLFTLKAYAYLNMRLGNEAEARLVILKLLDLDPSDKLGARVLLNVLDRKGCDDDD